MHHVYQQRVYAIRAVVNFIVVDEVSTIKSICLLFVAHFVCINKGTILCIYVVIEYIVVSRHN